MNKRKEIKKTFEEYGFSPSGIQSVIIHRDDAVKAIDEVFKGYDQQEIKDLMIYVREDAFNPSGTVAHVHLLKDLYAAVDDILGSEFDG